MSNVRQLRDRFEIGAGKSLFYLLGLLHGHWNLENATRDVVLEDSYQDKSNINTGIGIAVPAAKILETLEQSFFVDQRKK